MTFMKYKITKSIAITATAAGLLLLAGCASNKPTKSAAATAKPGVWPLSIKDPAANESGAQIWAENCMRCHELRSPSQYTPAQWGVIIQYMRLKAGLTGEQAKKVLAFLQSASAH
jgi:cytochrome c5